MHLNCLLICSALPLLTALPAATLAAQQSAPAAAAAEDKTELTERERAFRRLLTDAVLVGHFQMTDDEGLQGRALLTPPKADRYSIAEVEKVSGEDWMITARIEYGEKDVTVPVMVRVVWAEDAAIITLDDVTLPLLGTYSARVMVHRGLYGGTWFGPGHAGVLSGQVLSRSAYEKLAPKPAAKPAP